MNKVISLKTLNEASAQDVFNQVVNHLLTQKEKSVNPKIICMYRGLNGFKCAAGCLIADDEYTPEMEGKAWRTLISRGTFYIGNTKVVIPTAHSVLIHDLQGIHDRDPSDTWEGALRRLCTKHMLKWEYEKEVDD